MITGRNEKILNPPSKVRVKKTVLIIVPILRSSTLLGRKTLSEILTRAYNSSLYSPQHRESTATNSLCRRILVPEIPSPSTSERKTKEGPDCRLLAGACWLVTADCWRLRAPISPNNKNKKQEPVIFFSAYRTFFKRKNWNKKMLFKIQENRAEKRETTFEFKM